jgi:hypothetical protein
MIKMKNLIDKLDNLIVKYEYELEQEDINTLCEAIGALRALDEIARGIKNESKA